MSEEDFFYAFNRLSNVDLEGNPHRVPTRFRHTTTTPCEALLEDRLSTSELSSVYVHRPRQGYVLATYENGTYSCSASINVFTLDELFAKHFTYVVKQDTKLGEGEAYTTIQKIQQEQGQALVSVEDQLTSIRDQMQLIRNKMDAVEDIVLLRKWNTELQNLKALESDLEHLLKTKDTDVKTEQEYKTLLERIRGEWDSMRFEQRKRAVNTLIDSINIAHAATCWYILTVHWRVPQGRVDEGFLWHSHGGWPMWTQEEDAIITQLYKDAPKEALMNSLPHRPWSGIKARGQHLGLKRAHRTPVDAIPINMSLNDYLFAGEHNLTLPQGEETIAWRSKCSIGLIFFSW